MEIRAVRLSVIPLLLTMTGLFLLAASFAVKQTKGSASLEQALVKPGISIGFSHHGLMSDISMHQNKPKQFHPVVNNAGTVNATIQRQLFTDQLQSAAASYIKTN